MFRHLDAETCNTCSYMLCVLYYKVHLLENILIQECCHPHRRHHNSHHYHHVTFQILFKGYFDFPSQYSHFFLTAACCNLFMNASCCCSYNMILALKRVLQKNA
jgi:hypothetical protein